MKNFGRRLVLRSLVESDEIGSNSTDVDAGNRYDQDVSPMNPMVSVCVVIIAVLVIGGIALAVVLVHRRRRRLDAAAAAAGGGGVEMVESEDLAIHTLSQDGGSAEKDTVVVVVAPETFLASNETPTDPSNSGIVSPLDGSPAKDSPLAGEMSNADGSETSGGRPVPAAVEDEDVDSIEVQVAVVERNTCNHIDGACSSSEPEVDVVE